MKTLYLITGATGHLGGTIAGQLDEMKMPFRALVQPGDPNEKHLPNSADIVYGDIRDKHAVKAFLTVSGYDLTVLIHAAGIVTIQSRHNALVHEVNVGGTKNLLTCCLEAPPSKLVHVSSVHALPQCGSRQIIHESDTFDPACVKGLYAKTKAEATALVLEAAKAGLDASIVHPSGIIGPYDYGRGHLTQLVVDYMNGSLFAGVKGGYDMVDVRDVAKGILACAEKGRKGECYILSNQYYAIEEVFRIMEKLRGESKKAFMLPLGLAKMVAPFMESYSHLKNQPPLFTAYSLYVLGTDDHFSHEKADRELGYGARPLEESIADTIHWLNNQGRIKSGKP